MSAESTLPKKTYKEVSVGTASDGFSVLLDGRAARTPGRNALVAPTKALADAVAQEWNEQDKTINQREMPLTVLLSKAIDGGKAAASEGRQEILKYLETDALCYRAEAPQKLVEHQADIWDPYIVWFKEEFGVQLAITSGVTAVQQPKAAAEVVSTVLGQASTFEVAGIANATKITGSALLALALWRDESNSESLFKASRLDEHFQAELWGEDKEAAERESLLQRDFYACAKFLRLLSAADN